MQQVLIVIHLIIVLALVGVVLLQRSEGGGLGMGGGGGGGVSGFMTGRGQANALTRATAILAALFFVTSLTLSILAARGRAPSTIFNAPASAPGSAAPSSGAQQGGSGSGGVLDQLRQLQPGSAPSTNPAPSTPAPAPSGPQAPTSQ